MRGQVEQAGLVLGPDPHPARVAGQEVGAEGHGRGSAAAVGECPRPALGVRRGQHGQDRGDANAAGDEQVAVCGLQLEVVAWPAGPDQGAFDNRVVNVRRSAPAARLTEHPDPPAGPVGGIAAQREVAGQAAPQEQVDVRARRPAGQRRPGRVAQVERDDAVGHGGPARDDQAKFGLGVRHDVAGPGSPDPGWAGWASSHCHIDSGSCPSMVRPQWQVPRSRSLPGSHSIR